MDEYLCSLPIAYTHHHDMVAFNPLYEAKTRKLLTPADGDRRPRVGLLVQTFTCGKPDGMDIFPRPFRIRREGADGYLRARKYWLSSEVRNAYTEDNAKVDAAFVTTIFPERVLLPTSDWQYAPDPVPYNDIHTFFHSYEPSEFVLLQGMSEFHYREVMRETIPAESILDIPTTMLSLDTDRATVEAFGIGRKLFEVIQTALVHLVFRDYGRAGQAVDHIIGCAKALRHLIGARARAARPEEGLSVYDFV